MRVKPKKILSLALLLVLLLLALSYRQHVALALLGVRQPPFPQVENILVFEAQQQPLAKQLSLLTHLSVAELGALETQASHWTGPHVAAIYVLSHEIDAVEHWVATVWSPKLARTLTLVVYVRKQPPDEHTCYPENILMLLAARAARTEYGLLADVDMLPSLGLAANAWSVQLLTLFADTRADALVSAVVPVFEAGPGVEQPASKPHVVQLHARGVARAGDAQLFADWKDATEPVRLDKDTPPFGTAHIVRLGLDVRLALDPHVCGTRADRIAAIALRARFADVFMTPTEFVIKRGVADMSSNINAAALEQQHMAKARVSMQTEYALVHKQLAS